MTSQRIHDLTRQLDAQKAILADPTQRYRHRSAQLQIEKLTKSLAAAKRDQAAREAIDKELEAKRKQRQANARADLEARLMSEYIASAPGTTETEAKDALPELLHRYRLAEQTRKQAAVARARSRGVYRM